MIRPQPARWFELVVARDDAYAALEALAAAGCVEVEAQVEAPADGAAGAAPAALLKELAELARRYRPYWPAPATRLAPARRAPAQMLADSVAALGAWAREADATIAGLQAAETEAGRLALVEDALRALAPSGLDFAALARAQAGVTAALFALPASAEAAPPQALLAHRAALPEETLWLVVGAPADVEAFGRRAAEAGGRSAPLPAWLQPSAPANLAQVAARRGEAQRQAAALRAALAQAAQRHGLADALGTVARASWCFEQGGAIRSGEVFARVTGWTVDAPRVVAAVEHSGARALATFPPPPRGLRPPLVLRNPWWARPFEVFPRLVGMPGATDADPSALLAFAVPLMFGYMFGDVGQGLVLALAGWLLRRRLPVLRLLVPGGLAAAAFGFVFGSVFSLESVAHPLWVAPLEAPLAVLLLPLAGGALLLAGGLLLAGCEAFWARDTPRWLATEAPVLVAYAGAAIGCFDAAGWALVALAALWALLGAALVEHSHGTALKAALAGLGEWVERVLQLAVNTLSFARVGAFALAHAGLASAVLVLAEAAGHPAAAAAVLVLGNLLIILIEGLVVSIQTTRLVLFEFFTRFFRAEGRAFRPLAAPPVTTEEA